MKECCGLCPFAHTGTLALHPDRAADFAFMASSPYSDFPCHKTAVEVEDDYEGGGTSYVRGEKSLTCHGFKTLQMAENASEEQYEQEGFKPDGNGFEDPYEMIDCHTEILERDRS